MQRRKPMPAPPNDTSPAAQAVLDDLAARTPPEVKVAQVFAMNEALRELARARILAQYGAMPEREQFLRMAATTLPRDLMIAAYGWDPDVHGW